MNNLLNSYTIILIFIALIHVPGYADPPTTTAPLDEFRAYARFPQGLPEAIGGQSRKPKKNTQEIAASSKPIEQDASAANSVKSSTPQSKSTMNRGLGLRMSILGTSVSGIDINAMPGGELSLSFGKGPLIIYNDYRFFFGTHQDSEFGSVSTTIGGRYHFLNKRNISPYLGGGFTWGYAHYERMERELQEVCQNWDVFLLLFLPIPYCEQYGEEWRDVLYTYKGGGIGAHGIIGIEFRHLHQSRFNLELRIDNPLYELELDSPTKQRSIPLGTPFSLGMSWLYQF